MLVYDISRFSRGGTNETGYYLHRLKLAGVEAVFTAERIPEGDEGELLQGVKSWQARQYSVKLARDSIRGTISHITQKQSAPGGRAMCMLTNIPADALDAWVLQKVRDVVLGDHATVAKAVDAFVRAVLGQRAQRPDAGDAQRDLDLLNRRIRTTVGLLADPAFDGLDELRTTLADLKAKRDAARKRIAEAAAPTGTPVNEKALRTWAAARFRQLADACARRSSALDTRQLVHAYVERIEIDPHAKRGVLYLPADTYALYARSVSTRGALEDYRVAVKRATNGSMSPKLIRASPFMSQLYTSQSQ